MPVTVCGVGNTAQPVPGYPRFVIMTSAAIGAGLIEAGVVGAGAVALAALLAGATYDLTVFCGTDPPADPVLTATDIANALNFLNPVLQIPAADRLTQWFQHWYWYKVCQCVGAATPNPPALSLPTTVGVGAGLPATSTGTSCGSAGTWFETNSFPVGCDYVSAFFNGKTVPATATGVNITFNSAVNAGAAAYPFTYTMTFKNAGGTIIGTSQWMQNADILFANRIQMFFPVPATSASFSVDVQATAPCNTTSQGYDVQFDWFCGSGPGGLSTPCCAPDTSVVTMLQNILQLLLSMSQATSTKVGSYVVGLAHSGLTGAGSQALESGTIAIKVALTTDLSSYGSLPGDPTYLLDRGFIVALAAEGPIRTQVRLVYNPQVYQLPQLTDAIGYQFNPGLVGQITELSAGP